MQVPLALDRRNMPPPTFAASFVTLTLLVTSPALATTIFVSNESRLLSSYRRLRRPRRCDGAGSYSGKFRSGPFP